MTFADAFKAHGPGGVFGTLGSLPGFHAWETAAQVGDRGVWQLKVLIWWWFVNEFQRFGLVVDRVI